MNWRGIKICFTLYLKAFESMMVFLILNLDIEQHWTGDDKDFPLLYFSLLSNKTNLQEMKTF
jgi:hypothetical protein